MRLCCDCICFAFMDLLGFSVGEMGEKNLSGRDRGSMHGQSYSSSIGVYCDARQDACYMVLL
jgi:hypothetical protein